MLTRGSSICSTSCSGLGGREAESKNWGSQESKAANSIHNKQVAQQQLPSSWGHYCNVLLCPEIQKGEEGWGPHLQREGGNLS